MCMISRAAGVVFLASAVALGGLGVWTGGAVDAGGKGKGERHPHIHAAIKALHKAKRELTTAAHDFGGHRVAAVQAVDHAIGQLEMCLKFDRR